MNIIGFLVKRRNILLAVMTALAVVCAFLIPKINIIMEVTFFLPDDSPMKIGLEQIEEDFPGTTGQLSMLSVMLEDVADKEAEEKTLTEITGGLLCVGVKDNEPYTLYQFLLTQDCDYQACKERIKQHYDGNVVVEVDLDKNMPADVIPMVTTGAIIVFVVLLIMCSSLMEVVLFLLCTLLAIAINMGSNLILVNVSYLTFTMVAVLQMILSMDYSIIIMNRYRQEKRNYPGDNAKAMEVALKLAAPSVLSSAFTTIVSLLMLMFMHLKIGMDMGVVLSKGVLCSMICNFTVLPALILLFDKAIVKTEKKRIPDFSSRKLARFEVRWRVALTVLFVGIFCSAFVLQKRTEISFSAIWETEIPKYFPPHNPMVLLYETEEEDAVPSILDTLSRDPKVESCLSYPGLIKRGYTISEMAEQLAPMSAMVSEDLLRVVYYSYSHPNRTERMSLNEIQDLAEELAEQGLVPAEFDMKSIVAKFKQPSVPKSPSAIPSTPIVSPTPIADSMSVASSDSTVAVVAASDSLANVASRADSTYVAVADSIATPATAEGMPIIPKVITYEMVSEQLTAKQVSARYGIERSLVNTIYRMAGRKRKPATMSPYEIFTFVNNKLLHDKRYANFVEKEEKELFMSLYRQVDSAFVAGPTPVDELLADVENTASTVDSLSVISQTDSLANTAAAGGAELAQNIVVSPASGNTPDDDDDEPVVITPLERLAEMSFSGRKYDSRTVRKALAAAGIRLNQDDLDLLYMYAGSRKWKDNKQRMSINDLVSYIDETLMPQPALARFFDDETRQMLSEAKDNLTMAATTMRSDHHSIAAVFTDYPYESTGTFAFLDRFQELADRSLSKDHVIISESAMYKEIKEEFPHEMLLLTILTVVSIFIIVALTFHSLVIPLMLVLAVMSGVYVNVFVSGLGGNTMYFLAYLIVQSILMGATIDYSILFMSYYRDSRLKVGVPGAISSAYRGASHSILTSGLIITLGPLAMSFIIKDQMVATILKCLASGALSAVLVIFLVLPGAVALCDILVAPKGAVKSFGNK